MGAQRRVQGTAVLAGADESSIVNEVRLTGRLSAQPEARELPSGDTVVVFRVVVDRAPDKRSKVSVDAIECTAWSSRARRAVLQRTVGDVVSVEGSLRRRFFRTAAGPASRVEVEASRVTVVRRARSG